MATGRWVFDTSVYIAAIGQGVESSLFVLLQDRLPRTHLASVVSAELRAGATTEAARRTVSEFTRWAHRVGRVVTPSAASWERAGDILGQIRRARPEARSRVPRLWNDVLIALCARQIGAAVVTLNVEDFRLIARYLRFELGAAP